MKRAVVVFLENKPILLLQFGWLYTSLQHIQPNDTDIVVFGTKEALENIPDDCIKISCKTARELPEASWYPRLNNIYYFLDPQIDILRNYDYILRTDADTFLTPAWNHYYPKFYTAGRGGYVNNVEVRENLRRVAGIHGLNHKGIHNVGATHYGPANEVIAVSQKAVELAKYLLTHDFKEERGKWPGWYGGVINMYSNEIALNHCIENFQVDKQNLDFPSTSTDSVNIHAHLHCWHTDKQFSKFHFEKGNYDHIKMEDLDLSIVKDYCLYIALKARENQIL
ncbi:MAG TPA: hypothetical protein VEV44_08750 [Pseudoneobacillus sp.]|nr:hypothetical protein [Pseudoneobacillus sp.]